MDKSLIESTGMAVLRPIAKEHLKKDPSIKNRIWSKELEAWGFFSNEEVTHCDIFLLWCSVLPGDRVVFKLDEEKQSQIALIINVWKESTADRPFWIYRLLDQSGRIVKISIEERELFKQALKLAF